MTYAWTMSPQESSSLNVLALYDEPPRRVRAVALACCPLESDKGANEQRQVKGDPCCSLGLLLNSLSALL